MIYTFYSYKGGVGRTMALANVAELFYQEGYRVLMVDWDLEAPGLERFFPSIDLDDTLDKPGLVDMLLRYKEQMAQDIDEDTPLKLESPEDYIIHIPRERSGPGRLSLLTAGRRSKPHFANYAQTVLTFDWKDFYKSWGGELYINWLREEFESIADVILIDSRTGVTELGGVCIHHLADIAVMFCAPNQQNIAGIYDMIQTFTDPKVQNVRRERPLPVIIIPARIERAEGNLLDKFQKEFTEKFKDLVPREKGIDIHYLWESNIPYIPKYAYDEQVAVRESNLASARDITEAFRKLSQAMGRLSGLKIDSAVQSIPEPTQLASTITWLHLSDLHMRRDELDNLRVVLAALWRDLPSQITALGGQLDFIAFTGDIAHSGRQEEYKLAEEHFFQPLLDVTQLSPLRLFLVPGNHDVDRKMIEFFDPKVTSRLANREVVNELLQNDSLRQFLLSPMRSYTNFVQRFFGQFPDHPLLRDPPYSYAQRITLGSRSVTLIGLNSAWLSGFAQSSTGEVNDRGNLLIGDKQVHDAFQDAKGASVRIVLMHHPLHWLKEFDADDLKKQLQKRSDFVLRGHLHDPSFIILERGLSGNTITIPAGRIYASREWHNGYNLVQLNLDTGTGTILLRRYSEQRREWVKDVLSTGDVADGCIHFQLPWSVE